MHICADMVASSSATADNKYEADTSIQVDRCSPRASFQATKPTTN